MFTVITDWHRKNPNFWCAVDGETNELVFADVKMEGLMKMVDESGRKDLVFCTNWYRPASKAEIKFVEDFNEIFPNATDKQRIWMAQYGSEQFNKGHVEQHKCECEISNNRSNGRKFIWRLAISCAVGVGIGLLISFYAK